MNAQKTGGHVLCTKNGEQVIEENHNQGHGSKRAMKHATCIYKQQSTTCMGHQG
jgi:hypothetical protein